MRKVFRKKILAASISITCLAFAPSAIAAFDDQSVIAQGIKDEAEACAAGEADGSIGKAIEDALKIHTELASAMPNVEELFTPAGDCFAGLIGMFDLSFAIPSLGSIIGAVTDAVNQYAQKKICSAVHQVSSMVTGPINQAISGLNQNLDLTGMVNNAVGSQLSSIDPELGAQYRPPAGSGEYNVNVDAFNGSQVSFDPPSSGGSSGSSGGSSSGVGGGGSSGASGQINTGSGQINALNNQIAGLQAKVGPAQRSLSQARQNLNTCRAQQHNVCTNYEVAVQNAQNNLDNLNMQIGQLKSQLPNTQSASAPAAQSAPRSGTSSSGGGGVLDRLGSFLQ